VAEGVREKGLADADRPDDRDVVMGLEEAEGGELVEDGAVEGDLRRGIPVLELGRMTSVVRPSSVVAG